MNYPRMIVSRLMFAILALLSSAALRLTASPMTDYVAAMQPGTNWGNTLDAVPNETSWGAPMTTQPMIQGLAAKGYKSLRLPVTWNLHMGAAPDYTIDPAFMDRVAQIVQWALDANLYVMVNMHHDGWVGDMGHDHDAVLDRYQKVWLQIATRFKDYPNKLMFESKNEPGFQDANGHDLPAEQMRALMDELNTAFVHVVRSTGGGNATRPLVLPPVYTSSDQPFIDSLKATMAHLNDPNLIATIHNYGYYPFSVNMGGNTKFDDIVRYYLDTSFKALHDTFVAEGIPVIIGEWGVLTGDSVERGELLRFHEYLAQLARKNNLTTMLWDTGGIYNRTTQDWQPANRDLAEIIHQAELGGRGTTSQSDLLFLTSDTANQNTVINLNLNGNSVVSVQDGATVLTPTADYTLAGSVLTLNSAVLAKYAAAPYGEKTVLTINVNAGPAWKIHVRFAAAPVASGFSSISGGAALSIPTTFNGDVLATIESRYADGSNAGPVGWSAFPYWGSDFHPDYANNAIVLSSGFFAGAPANSVINFKFHFWSGKVLNYQVQLQPAPSSTGPDYVIYDDGLAYGWYDWGWMSYNLHGTDQVHSGTNSITINPSPYGGLALPSWATPDMTSYHTLTFWINGGATGGQYIGIGPIFSNGSWGNGAAVTAPANTWQKVEIPLASIGAEGNPNVNGFYIQHWKGESEPTLYIDDIHLTSAYASWQQQITGTPLATPPPATLDIVRNGIHVDNSTNQVVQTVQVTNSGTQAVAGPIYLVVDGLSTNATLANATGYTARFVSTGTSYITMTTGGLAPGQKATVTLQFSSPTPGGALPGGLNHAVTYTPRVISGGENP